MHLYMLKWKKRSISSSMTKEERKQAFLKVYNSLPIFENDELKLYVNRVPNDAQITGDNHNDDHQAARHGTYAFLLSRLYLRDIKADTALRRHFFQMQAYRGFKVDPTTTIKTYNPYNVSGDQLIGLTLAMLDDVSEKLRIDFINTVEQIVDNDWASKSVDQLTKSHVAMWQPGLETVGAQALTILSILKMASKFGSAKAKKAYNKLLYMYGYGLLSLIPTTFSIKNRNYSNDHNCIISAYILAKLSTGMSKLYWTMIMLYCWSLSYKWLNGYFTGIIMDVCPIFTKKYVQKCKDYLYEEVPNTYAKSIYWNPWIDQGVYPIKFNDMNQGEFWPDEVHQARGNDQLTKSGLGWLAAAIMIDQEEAKEFLEK